MAATPAKELGWLCSMFPESSRISERQPPQLNPPKTGPQQRLLSLMSFHCFILSASVISDSGLPPVVRSHRPRRCCSFRLVCNEPAASSFLPFFLSFFVQGYKFKTCLSCVVSGPFLAPSSILRPPQRGLGSSHSCCTPGCYRLNSVNSVQPRRSVSQLIQGNFPVLFPAFELLSLQ